jgi:hypothetical protein
MAQIEQEPGSLEPLPALRDHFTVQAVIPDPPEHGPARSVGEPLEIAQIDLELDGAVVKTLLQVVVLPAARVWAARVGPPVFPENGKQLTTGKAARGAIWLCEI